MLVLSLAPLVLFVVLIFWGKLKIVWTSLVSLLVTLLLVIFVWQMNSGTVEASLLKGVFVAADILIIILGAVFFLETLKSTKIIHSLCLYLETISKDYRIQIILLAWFFENFLEGTAGFGTPSTVVAPMLIGIGLTPILSVVVALLGNSTSVVFGAAGTPIRLGFAGLNTIGVPFYSALINTVGFIVPVFMLWAITSGQRERKTHFFEALPFAIFSGIVFVVPSVFLVFLGQEFPSIIGSIIGFLIMFLCIKFKFLIPKTTRILIKENLETEKMPVVKMVFPYILLIVLLIAGKFLLSNIGLTINFGLSHTFNLFNPGLAFIITSLVVVILWKTKSRFAIDTLKKSFKVAFEPFLTIAIISAMIQLMVNSGQNISGYNSILQIIANNFKTFLLPLIAPIIGAFGSFLTGSATVSNIMFGDILQSTSLVIGLNGAIILSLQLVGAAAGNMISLADILPAQAVVGIRGQEREIIKQVIVPCAIYFLLVGIIGMLIA